MIKLRSKRTPQVEIITETIESALGTAGDQDVMQVYYSNNLKLKTKIEMLRCLAGVLWKCDAHIIMGLETLSIHIPFEIQSVTIVSSCVV